MYPSPLFTFTAVGLVGLNTVFCFVANTSAKNAARSEKVVIQLDKPLMQQYGVHDMHLMREQCTM